MADLAGRLAVCIGAGDVAARKVSALLDAGAHVTVIAPEASEQVERLASQDRLTWRRRPYDPADLDGALIVVAATDSAEVNADVAAAATARGTLCVRADGGGTADFAAAVRRGPVTIAVATQGRAPALARRLRDELEVSYGAEYGLLAQLLGELREDPVIRARLGALPGDRRAARWRAILDTDILTLLRNGEATMAREVATACLFSSSD